MPRDEARAGGPFQVPGLHGTTERESQFTDRLQSDLGYLASWSIWRDIKIMITTFGMLVHRELSNSRSRGI